MTKTQQKILGAVSREFERGFKAAWDVWMGKEAENVEGIIQRLEDI